ncbi:hypothetical protein GCM10010371_63780 [Streptomyces subrutilus]|uniref:Uncharacterized protein n=1 Tax=Streptomyces subrutilus TaxID=36818 RepID=A0A918RDM3_9ACTN|nr:hypothetical protein GCM10010371_63780 [Streptomyces subrutilus]
MKALDMPTRIARLLASHLRSRLPAAHRRERRESPMARLQALEDHGLHHAAATRRRMPHASESPVDERVSPIARMGRSSACP